MTPDAAERDLPTQPWDFPQAVTAARRAAEVQKAGEQAVRDAAKALADAETAYRVELAKEIVRQRNAGIAATVAQDMARGQERVADLRHARDIQEGVLKATEQRAWRHTADRRDTLEFITWSRIFHARDANGTVTPWGASS